MSSKNTYALGLDIRIQLFQDRVSYFIIYNLILDFIAKHSWLLLKDFIDRWRKFVLTQFWWHNPVYIRICHIKVHIFTGLKSEGNLPLVAVVIYNKIMTSFLYCKKVNDLVVNWFRSQSFLWLNLLQNLWLFTHPEKSTDVV